MEYLPDIIDASKQWGWLGGLGATLSVVVAVYRRWIDPLLPSAARWENLPKWARIGIVFAFASVGATLVALAQGAPWLVIVQLAASSGFSAIGVHQVASAVFPGQKDPAIPFS